MIRSFAFLLLPLAGMAQFAYAHNAICDCYDNGDTTVTCEGGFSDGGGAAGVALRIVDDAGKVLIEGVMSDQSDFSFTKPEGNLLFEVSGIGIFF